MFRNGQYAQKHFRISVLALDSTRTLWYYNAHEETEQLYDEGTGAGRPQGNHDH